MDPVKDFLPAAMSVVDKMETGQISVSYGMREIDRLDELAKQAIAEKEKVADALDDLLLKIKTERQSLDRTLGCLEFDPK
ncbi:hypothetical protein [Mariprofundus ferrooxydans]|uniref:hypothetical protein n=1 Tax=Mariprofundus ferrooxydans TaxID=314344 RepID=UPI00036B7B39|nr:hypothetical protein [Mariprofundus ferrooxydans]